MSRARRSRAELNELELRVRRSSHGFRGAVRAARGRPAVNPARLSSSIFPPLRPEDTSLELDLSVAPEVDPAEVFTPAEMPGVRLRPQVSDSMSTSGGDREREVDAVPLTDDGTRTRVDDAVDAEGMGDETDRDQDSEGESEASASLPPDKPFSIAGFAAVAAATLAMGGRAAVSVVRKAVDVASRWFSAGVEGMARGIAAQRSAAVRRAEIRAEKKARDRAATEKAKAAKAKAAKAKAKAKAKAAQAEPQKAKPTRPAKSKTRSLARSRFDVRPVLNRVRVRVRKVGPPSKKQVVAGGGGLAIALVGYIAAQVAVADTVAPGVQILGVDLGGMNAADAAAALAPQATDVNASEILLIGEGWVFGAPVAEAGLAVDIDATVDSLTGFTMAPSRLWEFVVGSEGMPVTSVDTDALAVVIDAAAEALDRDVRDADVLLSDGRAHPVHAVAGVVVDKEAAAVAVAAYWPASDVIELPAAVEEPDVPTEEARRAARMLNANAFDKDTVLTSPNGDVELTPELVTDYGDMVVVSGHLNLVVDGDALADDLRAERPGLENGAVNARLDFDSNQQLVVFPGVPAREVDAESLGPAVVAAITSISRSVPFPYRETAPDVATEDVADTPFTDLVSTFRTPFTPRGWAREQNIANAARLISGRVVEPGAIFSLDAALSPIVGSNGFRSAGVIIGGEHTDAMGGGLSQMATTLYNAAYFAGMEDIQHREHSEWFARYPAGREATLWSGVLDVKFRNNTPYPILINSYIDGAGIRVDFWSTPYYDEVTSTQRYSRTPRQGCAFKVWDTRTIILNGDVIAEETQSWSYRHTQYCG